MQNQKQRKINNGQRASVFVRCPFSSSHQEQKAYIAQLLHMKGFPSHIVEMAKQHVTADDGTEWEALIYYGEKAHRRYEKYDRYTYEQKMKQALYRKGFSLSLIEQFLEKKKED